MTKLIKFFIFSIFSISCSEILFSSEIINLPDGRSINLKSDGTYEFLSTKKENLAAAAIFRGGQIYSFLAYFLCEKLS